MQQQIANNLALGASSWSSSLATINVSGVDQLTVSGQLTGGALAATDLDFRLVIQYDDGTTGYQIPSVRTQTDGFGGNVAGRVSQFDVRGIRNVQIFARNNNASVGGNLTAYTLGNARYSASH